MPEFSYKAIDGSGRAQSGNVEAVDEASALQQISQLGLTPVRLKEGSQSGPWWSRDIQLFGGTAEFRQSDIEAFFQTLATMTKAQLPLPRNLKLAEGLARAPSFKSHLQKSQKRLQDGQTLSSALEDGQNRFPKRLLRLIELGERSNSLSEMSGRVAQMLKRERELKAELSQSLVYPVILLLMSLVVGAILVFYLTPTLLPVFASSGAEPPFVIAAMDWLRRVLTQYWWVLSFGILFVLLAGMTFKKVVSGIWGRVLLVLPGFGPYFKDRDFLAFCNALDLMQSSGARLLEGVRAAEGTVVLPAWKALTRKIADDIQTGHTLSSTLAKSNLPDPALVSMIKAAEEANRLSDVLPVACQTLETRARTRLSSAVKLITPVLTLLIGVSVGGVILSTIGAILDLNDALY